MCAYTTLGLYVISFNFNLQYKILKDFWNAKTNKK